MGKGNVRYGIIFLDLFLCCLERLVSAVGLGLVLVAWVDV